MKWKKVNALSTDSYALVRLSFKCVYSTFLKKCSLMPNALTWYANYYSVEDIKGWACIFVALHAKCSGSITSKKFIL